MYYNLKRSKIKTTEHWNSCLTTSTADIQNCMILRENSDLLQDEQLKRSQESVVKIQ